MLRKTMLCLVLQHPLYVTKDNAPSWFAALCHGRPCSVWSCSILYMPRKTMPFMVCSFMPRKTMLCLVLQHPLYATKDSALHGLQLYAKEDHALFGLAASSIYQ